MSNYQVSDPFQEKLRVAIDGIWPDFDIEEELKKLKAQEYDAISGFNTQALKAGNISNPLIKSFYLAKVSLALDYYHHVVICYKNTGKTNQLYSCYLFQFNSSMSNVYHSYKNIL